MLKRAIDVAVTQLGVKEATNNNDGIPADRYCRGRLVAWCAYFALWCNAQSGDERAAPTEKDWWEMGAVQTFEDRMRDRDRWLPGPPQVNDFIFFGSRGGSDAAKGGRHMGLVESVAGPIITTIEGNLGNAVQRQTHDLNDPKVRDRITGYARMKTAGSV